MVERYSRKECIDCCAWLGSRNLGAQDAVEDALGARRDLNPEDGRGLRILLGIDRDERALEVVVCNRLGDIGDVGRTWILLTGMQHHHDGAFERGVEDVALKGFVGYGLRGHVGMLPGTQR